jgi:hypothetical protein
VRKEFKQKGRKEGKGREIWRSFGKTKTWTGLVARSRAKANINRRIQRQMERLGC